MSSLSLLDISPRDLMIDALRRIVTSFTHRCALADLGGKFCLNKLRKFRMVYPCKNHNTGEEILWDGEGAGGGYNIGSSASCMFTANCFKFSFRAVEERTIYSLAISFFKWRRHLSTLS